MSLQVRQGGRQDIRLRVRQDHPLLLSRSHRVTLVNIILRVCFGFTVRRVSKNLLIVSRDMITIQFYYSIALSHRSLTWWRIFARFYFRRGQMGRHRVVWHEVVHSYPHKWNCIKSRENIYGIMRLLPHNSESKKTVAKKFGKHTLQKVRETNKILRMKILEFSPFWMANTLSFP